MRKDKLKFWQNTWIITILVFLFAIVIGYLAWLQLKSYEEGVMEVYALQQDGYVQLVLDQINLEKDRATDEIISNILGTLDASTNKYWTLSERDALIFVRDVMETNRYRGFSTATYYESDAARAFLHSLQLDRVTHDTIELSSRSFVASGVRFAYRGEQMQITLLTSADAVLDQNEYLNAKINISILAIAELTILVLSAIGLTALSQKWRRKSMTLEAENAKLLATVEKCNDILSKRELYDTRRMVFHSDVLQVLLPKLEARSVWPLHFILLSCDTDTDQKRFLRESQVIMDRSYFRFVLQPRELLLIGVKLEDAADQAILAAIREPGIQVTGTLTLKERPAAPLTRVFQDFYQQGRDSNAAQVVS